MPTRDPPNSEPTNGQGNGARTTDSTSRSVWATLVTGEKYLPGICVFAESLLRGSPNHPGSKYPLVAMVTSEVSSEAIEAMQRAGCFIRPVKTLHPGHNRGEKSMAFARFGQVWTKLRAFELTEYDRVIMVDSDMLVRRNMDELMVMPLQKDHIMATFACTCNSAKHSTYPKDWIPENCAYTAQSHPEHTRKGMKITADSRDTYHRLNSGLVILQPSLTTMRDIEVRIKNDPDVETYRFPDQDLLAEYFRGRFIPLPYVYNALKKLRNVHPQLWRDEEVKNVHYILDKPWSNAIPDPGDAVTHQWWWDAYKNHSWPTIVSKYVLPSTDE